MKIGIASDHRGYNLKQEVIKFLKKNCYNVIDYGTTTSSSTDYSDYGILLGRKVSEKEVDYGIAFCGTGIGISIACNKVHGVRCAKVDNEEESRLAREHNDANVVAISSTKEIEEIIKIIEVFLNTNFSNDERHKRRISKINEYENEERLI